MKLRKARLAALALPALALAGLGLAACDRQVEPLAVTYYYLPG